MVRVVEQVRVRQYEGLPHVVVEGKHGGVQVHADALLFCACAGSKALVEWLRVVEGTATVIMAMTNGPVLTRAPGRIQGTKDGVDVAVY